MGGLSGDEVVDRIDRGGEEDRVAVLAGLIAEGSSQVTLAQADATDEHRVGLFGEEAQTEEILDLDAVDLFGPAPIELVHRLDHRKAGGADASFQGALLPAQAFAFEQTLEVVHGSPVLRRGLFGQAFIVLAHVVEAQVIEMGDERSGGIHDWS